MHWPSPASQSGSCAHPGQSPFPVRPYLLLLPVRTCSSTLGDLRIKGAAQLRGIQTLPFLSLVSRLTWAGPTALTPVFPATLSLAFPFRALGNPDNARTRGPGPGSTHADSPPALGSIPPSPGGSGEEKGLQPVPRGAPAAAGASAPRNSPSGGFCAQEAAKAAGAGPGGGGGEPQGFRGALGTRDSSRDPRDLPGRLLRASLSLGCGAWDFPVPGWLFGDCGEMLWGRDAARQPGLGTQVEQVNLTASTFVRVLPSSPG